MGPRNAQRECKGASERFGLVACGDEAADAREVEWERHGIGKEGKMA